MTEFEINGRRIGTNYPAYIIAEACDNHMGDLDQAMQMCRLAKLAGADCIKFQHHLPDEEMLKDVPMSSNFDIPLYEFLQKHALKLDDHIKLFTYCKEIGITYLCTPFSLKAAYEINEIGVSAFKIGSGEMTDIPTLLAIAKLGKPMIISTGMSSMQEIKRTYDALMSLDSQMPLALMNCLSEYPPNYEDMNLKFIQTMQKEFECAVIGHSDHAPDLFTCFAAVSLGAKIIEKHLILDKKIKGPDQSVSIDFNDLHQLVDGVRKIEAALGNEKFVHKNEQSIREWAFRSIVACCDIKKGQIIESNMIWSKRPGTGIPSHKMSEIIGKTATQDIKANALLKYTDFE